MRPSCASSVVTKSASERTTPVPSRRTDAGIPPVVIDCPIRSDQPGVQMPGSPPGRESWNFKVPLITRFGMTKNGSEESISSKVLDTDGKRRAHLDRARHVEREWREVPLVMSEVAAVEVHVGEVVDGVEDEALMG
jgi:hypothetical protein